MARLTALPSIDIIHGFRGILDFYLWKGLPCVRSWPRMTKAQQSPATIDAGILFGQISTSYRLLAPLALEAFQEDAKTQPRTARDIYMTGVFGHLHSRAVAPPPPPPEEEMYDAYVCLRDKKAQGTSGGTFTLGAWRTRDLTDEQADTLDLCTLAANQFVLAPGTYRCLISCPAWDVNYHQARLFNITGAALILAGTCDYSHSADPSVTRSVIAGRFTVAAEQTLQIQHQCSATKVTTGFGIRSNWTEEIYTLAEFWREIPPA